MIPAIRLYQYAAPLALTPLSLYLWWTEYGNWPQSLTAWLVPVLWAYIVPAVGTNVRKVWEFDVRWKWGRFRPHHGFVFGSAAAMLAWLAHGPPAQSPGDVLRFSLVLCSVLGFWNLLYEVKALRTGLLIVRNEPWARGRGEEAIAFDYAPWFFGGFGAAHGLAIGLLELLVRQSGPPAPAWSAAYVAASLALCIALPVLGFIRHSLKRHGHSGTRPIKKEHSS
ncbi:MAG: hypothetical protein LBQ62_11145 [Candidatus Accumulibacter sp.]|jgi:hypothetical protein|nr:hypothetical protein [Accumulibacter sp.]